MTGEKSYKREKSSERRQEKKEKERHPLEQVKRVRRKGWKREAAGY